MKRAGFVLVGGASSRMGTDKALLDCGGMLLVERVAWAVASAAGNAALVGPPELYGHLGWPVIADLRTERGPLGGVEAVLSRSQADWNLIVGCDMPGIRPEFLITLFEEAEHSGVDCLVPLSGPGQPEPLCAVWHRRLLGAVSAALDDNILKMKDLFACVKVRYSSLIEPELAVNLNTAEDLRRHVSSSAIGSL